MQIRKEGTGMRKIKAQAVRTVQGCEVKLKPFDGTLPVSPVEYFPSEFSMVETEGASVKV
jgi:hypothetical protein